MPISSQDIERSSNGKPKSNYVLVVGEERPRLVDIDDIDEMVERGEIEKILPEPGSEERESVKATDVSVGKEAVPGGSKEEARKDPTQSF
ncbi:MAG: hypothetical protein ACYCOU_23535 [Sulfobacillus sp.]